MTCSYPVRQACLGLPLPKSLFNRFRCFALQKICAYKVNPSSMASRDEKKSYINTLVFTIISGIVSLILLVALFFPVGQKFMVAIITVEVGIFVIIGYCIYQIMTAESRLRKLKESNKLMVNFNECGDYYVRREDSNGKVVCSNDYIITDPSNDQYTMKIYADDLGTALPSTNEINPSASNGGFQADKRYETYYLKELETSDKLKTGEDKCKPLFFKDDTYRHYNNIPWTFAKSRCQSFMS